MLLITFKGRPVKRRRNTSQGLRLTFATPIPGMQGETIVVSEEDWQQYGKVEGQQQKEAVQAMAACTQHQ